MVFFFFRVAIAEGVEPQMPPSMPDQVYEPPADDTWQDKFINSNLAVSRWFDGLAESVDLFLVGKKITKKRNESSMRIENSTYSLEGEAVSNVSSIIINPRLHNLEEYWQLKFSTYDEREENRNVQRAYLRQSPRQQNYGTTLGFFQRFGDIRTSFQPRIELQDPLKISHSLSFESVADLKTYQVNPRLEFFATPSKGAGIFQAINVNFVLTKILSLTFINEGTYEDRTHLYSVTNGASLGQAISEKSAMGYSVFVNSSSQPSYYMKGYSFALSWSEIIYRNILDYQITPHLDFNTENEYKGVVGVNLHISLNF